MKTIGLRATPNEIWYTIIEGDKDKIKVQTCYKVNVPRSLNFPEQLSYIRTTFKDILFEYQVEYAGIRITESNAQSLSIERISLEAVLQELFSSSTVIKYFVGQISRISAKIGFPRDNFKMLLTKDAEFDSIPKWNTYNDKQKESILTAIAALNL